MSEMKLSERKQRILRALVDNYITNPEPVSSSEIRDRYLPDVSSATIRSELGALEELGYLVQPHISAGRIPSRKAYRFYVDNLGYIAESESEIRQLKEHFSRKTSEVEEVIRNTAKIISDITNYTSIVVMGGVEGIKIKEIKLVDIGQCTALVIIITDRGVLKDKMIDLPESVVGNYFISANHMINNVFAGKCLGDVLGREDLVEEEIGDFRKLCDEIIKMVSDYKEDRNNQVYLEGADKIFRHKEYENIENVKNFLSLINTKENLREIVSQDGDIEMSIRIGREEGGQENMAIVTARCIIDGKEIGHAGVIGPERMDYKKVISVLSRITRAFDKIED